MVVRFAVFILLPLLHCGCSHGPRFLEDGHLAYNEAVRQSSDHELLLNIVRLRYLDTIEFLSTNSISSQTAFSVGIGGRVGTEYGNSTGIGFGDVAWSDRPTFTFTPQRGQSFAKMMISPVPVKTLMELAASDWDINALMFLLVQNINARSNSPGLVDKEFTEIVRLLGDLQGRADLYFGMIDANEALSDPIEASQVTGADLVAAAQAGYRFQRDASGGRFVLTDVLAHPILYIPQEAPERGPLFAHLQMQDDGRDFIEIRTALQPEEYAQDFSTLSIDTRSVLEAVSYLTGGVQLPPSHLDQGIVMRDWPVSGIRSAGLGDLFVVHTSEKRPDATLAIQHRGNWFYIAENDMRSRMTFLILAEILRLALSPEDGQAPVLTLPVGR